MAKIPLTESHPELCLQWSSNNPVGPETVSRGSVAKYEWICPLYGDHNYMASPNSRTRGKSGRGCPYCAHQKLKKGFNDLLFLFPEIAEEWSDKNDLRPDEVFARSNKSYKWECKKSGHSYEARINNRTSLGRGCPDCAGRYAVPGKSDISTTHPEVAKVWSPNNTTDILSVKAHSGSSFLWICNTYGLDHEFESHTSSMIKTNGSCIYCSGGRLLPGFNDMATVRPDMGKDWSPKNPSPASSYFPQSSAWGIWSCPEGHTLEGTINNRFKMGCSVCSGRTVLSGVNDLETLRPDIASQWSETNTRCASSVSLGSGFRAEWVCPINPEHLWFASVNDRTRQDGKATGCPDCIRGRQSSESEKELGDFLTSIGVEFRTNDRRILKSGRELDIVIDDRKIAIEFNGVFHHSEWHVDKNYHYEKWSDAANAGYQLITIWSSDWKFKRTLVKTMLKHKLGVSEQKRVFARNTNVVSLSYEEASSFLELNHIQGKSVGSYYLGLEDVSGNLLSAMVLRRSGSTLRLERYSTSCVVVGGQSKLLSWVDRNINYDLMETFADLSVSDGSLYEKTGWVRGELLRPDYKYLSSGRLHHKFNFRKSNFESREDLKFSEGLTERELAKLNKLYRVYDCGKIKYTRTPK